MDSYKALTKAIVESMVIIIAADEKIYKSETSLLFKALEEFWQPNWGSIKAAVVSALTEVKLAQEIGTNQKKMIRDHAQTLANIFTPKEKKFVLETMEGLVNADGVADQVETELFEVFKTYLKPDTGLLGMFKRLVK